MPSETLRCVWPILDDTKTRTQLIDIALQAIADVAADEGVRLTGPPASWNIVDAATEPGWERHDGLLLVAAGSPAVRVGGPSARAQRCRRLLALHRQGMPDLQIAQRLGVGQATVGRDRAELGLLANGRGRPAWKAKS